MSGIFGVIAPKRQLNIQTLINKMAAAMSHREWFVAESMVNDEADVALGRIGIGIFNKSPQPVWNATHTLALVMAGEIYEAHKPVSQSDEQFVLALYGQYGASFVKRLNGAFIVGVWDKTRGQLIIANDRFGLYPFYYAHYDGTFIFAPEVKGILCASTFTRRLDFTALAQYIRFQQLLEERTFFEDIQLLPPASLLIYNLPASSFEIKPYWTFADIPYRPTVNFKEAVEETGRLFRRAVQRLSGDSYRPGVYLSGGLDSRAIVGMVARRPIVSLTYGQADCRDVVYAQQVAQAVGSEHHWFDLPDGAWVKEYADFHLTLTEGFHSWIHAHGISTLAPARQLIDINLTGWDGGTVMGHHDSIEPRQHSAVDELALTTRLFYLFNQKYTWPSLTEAEEKLVYTDRLGQQLWGVAFDSLRAELSKYFNYRPDVRGEYFYLRNHCGRSTQNSITFTRSHLEVRFPFFDYDLFDFLYSLPAVIRGHRLLYCAMIQRELPRLAYIPYGQDEFLPTTYPIIRRAHAAIIKFRRRFNRHVWPIFADHFTLYADYENYLRYELREWAENILFDPRTTARGIFNPVMLRSLLNRHLSGHEEWTIGKIAPLMTYEMMLRRFYD